MYTINEDYLKLPGSYLFSTIARKVKDVEKADPAKNIIRLGIGDVTLPLCPAVIEAMHKAVDEMACADTFQGYGPENGHEFLRTAMQKIDYESRGCHVEADEIFISDGAKSDSGNIQEIFGKDTLVAVCDPVYPVYLDTNVMAGRTGAFDETFGTYAGVKYLPCVPEHDFVPEIPGEDEEAPGLIYLCSPNNPTGTALTKAQLQRWVDYANAHKSVIIFDAAYEAYITEPDVPHSIYECEGARSCAIELRSFSKNAGFTGVRLGAAIVPHDIKYVMKGDSCSQTETENKAGDGQGRAAEEKIVELHSLWNRRHGTKFNGASYIVQRGGEAVYSPEGRKQTAQQVAYYMRNAAYIREHLTAAGYQVFGGVDAPYLWMKAPDGMTSWECFDYFLDKAGVVTTPGSGFGPHGEHFIRMTAFGSYENTVAAVQRLVELNK